jgi:hypothetical protein
VTTFAVKRDLAGISMEDLAGAQQAAIATSDRLRAEGCDVRYLRSIFEPASGRCTCLFEAADADAVARAQSEASLPYTDSVEALDLPPAS